MASLHRRAASVLAGSALAFSLVSVPATMVATAAAEPAACGTTATREDSNWSSAGTTFTVVNEVVAPGTAPAGGTLTYRVTVSGSGATITQLRHFHDPALVPVSARVSSWKLGALGQTWTNETNNMVKGDGVVRVNSSGWTTAGGQNTTLEVTYRVPAGATVGTTYDSGAGYNAALADMSPSYQRLGVCGTVREPNAVETAQGSLAGIGAGSLVEGSVSSSNISSDPSGFLGEVLGGILGNVVGGLVDS